MREQRGSKRVRVAVSVSLEAEQDFYAGITGDVGFGGVFVLTESPPAPGSQIRVDIALPTGGRIHADGTVRWVRTPDLANPDHPAGCGIAWQALDRRSLAAVRHFIRQQARTPDAAAA